MGRQKTVIDSKTDKEKRVNIGVPVNEKLWRGLRALAIKEGKLTGELLDKAIEKYILTYQ
jgi:hypothetical protein